MSAIARLALLARLSRVSTAKRYTACPLYTTTVTIARNSRWSYVTSARTTIPIDNVQSKQASAKESAQILLDALQHNPPATPKELSDRIAEARVTSCRQYLLAVINSARQEDSDSGFQTHLINKETCENLLDVIGRASANVSTARISSNIPVELLNLAMARNWEIDSQILQLAAIYLSLYSYYSYERAARLVSRVSAFVNNANSTAATKTNSYWSYPLSSQDISELTPKDLQRQAGKVLSADQKRAFNELLADDPIDTAIEIVRLLVETRQFQINHHLRAFLMKALRVHEDGSGRRIKEAEWLLAATGQNEKQFSRKGDICALMMSMNYQLGDEAAAIDLYTTFNLAWNKRLEQLVQTQVTPDQTAKRAELWRLQHQSQVENPQVLYMDELLKIRNQAAPPYYRFALELARQNKIEEALAFLEEAKSKQLVVFGAEQYGSIILALLVRNRVDQAYALYTSMTHSENADSPKTIAANRVFFGVQPSSYTATSLIYALSKTNDWDWIWRIVDGGTYNFGPHINCAKLLLEKAIDSGEVYQVARSSELIAHATSRVRGREWLINNEWIKRILTKTLESNKPAALLGFVTKSLFVDPAASNVDDAVEWNSQIFRIALNCTHQHRQALDPSVVSEVMCKLYDSIPKYRLLQSQQVCKMLQAIAKDVVRDYTPQNPDTLADSLSRQHVQLNKQFFECSIAAFNQCSSSSSDEEDIVVSLKRLAAACNITIVDTSSNSNTIDKVDGQTSRPLSPPPVSIRNISFGTPLPEKMEWYKRHQEAGMVPPLRQMSWFVSELMKKEPQSVWEPIVSNDVPGILLELSADRASEVSLRQRYATTILSSAVFKYTTLGYVEEAMVYYRRIVNEGSYPISQSTAAMLSTLSSTDQPLPVLPQVLHDDPAKKVFGLDPIQPPQGSSKTDQFLAPRSYSERRSYIADIGMSMLYESLRHKLWPTAHFYSVLLAVLGQAGRMKELRFVFETVMPNTMRSMPAKYRLDPAFMPSPVIWSMAIREAARAGDTALAELWFKEYRMSAMPIFREESSAYSRFVHRKQPKYARLLILSRPYYIIPPIKLPSSKNGTAPEPWYNLEQVEKQLEMDRLRALDKLPLAYLDATKMLVIYTRVKEHRDMESAEVLAGEIRALYEDKELPKHCRPRGNADLAYCWKVMVIGYINFLQDWVAHQLSRASSSSEVAELGKAKERLIYWYRQWRMATMAAEKEQKYPRTSNIALPQDMIDFVENTYREI